MNTRKHFRKRRRLVPVTCFVLVMLFGYLYWIRDQSQGSQVPLERIELAQAPPEVLEVIEAQASEYEVLITEHEGWIYVYYGINEGDYTTIDIDLSELKERYHAEITVTHAVSEEWISGYKLVRFQPLNGKPLWTKVKDETKINYD